MKTIKPPKFGRLYFYPIPCYLLIDETSVYGAIFYDYQL
jgi:hypothetical protein